MTERYYEEHGGKTIFLGRFVPVVRSAGFIVAGAAQMEWRRFIVYDVIGATLWGVGHTLLGYFLGASYERWEKYLTPFGIGLAVILLVLVGGSKMLGARRRVREELEEIEQELEREHELELEREPGIGRSEDHEVADGRVGPPAVHGGDGASDLHLKSGNVPFVRVDGELQPSPYPIVSPQETEAYAQALMPEHKRREFEATSEADFGYTLPGVGRFRINVFRQRGMVGLAIRRVRSEIPTIEELLLPPVVRELADSPGGSC